MIWAIARREILGNYASASGWIALAAAQLLLAWLLFLQLEVYLKILPELTSGDSPLGIIDLVISPTLSSTALVLLILIPLQGMGSFADELRSGRMALLLSAPVSPLRLVLGKWLGLLLGALPLVLLPLLMAWVLELGSAVDAGRLAASFLGLLLFASMVAAISIWLSSISEQPLTAAAMSWGLLFLLWLLDGSSGGVMQLLSLDTHLLPFLQGMVATQHLVYFLAITCTTLGLTTHRIWRLGGGE
ncbi:ABC transporter permease subunit [Thiolapillus sp.]